MLYAVLIILIDPAFTMAFRADDFCKLDYRSSSVSGAVILDDYNFHELVRLDSFDMEKTLSLVSEGKIL